MATIQAVLSKKEGRVIRIAREATVLEAARSMNQHRIGALVVTEGDKVVGIFTERDILNRVVAVERDAAQVRVEEVMTAPVAVCTPQSSLQECRGVMREKRIRHLPVVDKEQLVGMISIGDLSAENEAEQASTISYLYEYLYGEWPEVGGGI